MKHTHRFSLPSILLILFFIAGCAQMPANGGGNVEATVAAMLEATGEAQSAQATIEALQAALESGDETDAPATPAPVAEAPPEPTPVPVTEPEISQEDVVATAVAATRQVQDALATSVSATLTASVPDTPTPTFTPTYTPIPSDTPTPRPDAVVNTRALNMRRGPGTNYGIVSSYANGTELKVLGRSQGGNWLQVQAPDGKTGWMSKQLLIVNVASGSLVVAQAPPSPTPRPTNTPVPPTRTPTRPAPVVIPPTFTPTPVVAQAPREPVEVAAYCSTIGNSPRYVATNQPVILWWGWIAKSEYMNDYLDSVSFSLEIDGHSMNPYQAIVYTDTEGAFGLTSTPKVTKTWKMPSLILSAGAHRVIFAESFAYPIRDGFDSDNDGSLDVFSGVRYHSCEIRVG